MRNSFSSLASTRGAGLGNEIIGLGKAYIGAKVLGLRFVAPPWRLNPRKYHKEIFSPISENLRYGMSRVTPSQKVSLEMFLNTGALDYEEALNSLLMTGQIVKGRSTLHTSGMNGGYAAIQKARPYIQSLIFGAKSSLQNLEKLDAERHRPIRVGLHYRAGDFDNNVVQRGEFNSRVPIDWYVGILNSLRASLGEDFDLIFTSDAKDSQTQELFRVPGVNLLSQQSTTVADLSALASCDLLLCSVSSFSMLAAFISEAPYIWFEPQVSKSGGWCGIWANEENGFGKAHTLKSIQINQKMGGPAGGRGVLMNFEPKWTPGLLDFLRYRRQVRNRNKDLLYYGAVEMHV